jgi:hypothetical protein
LLDFGDTRRAYQSMGVRCRYLRERRLAGERATRTQDSTPFAGNRLGLSQESLSVGSSLTVHKGRWTGFVTDRGQFGSRWQDNGGTIGVRLAF